MTNEYLISADDIADLDRYTNASLPVGDETLRKDDAEPLGDTLEPDRVAGERTDDHTAVARFRRRMRPERGEMRRSSTPSNSKDGTTRSSRRTTCPSLSRSIPQTSSNRIRGDRP